MTMGPEPRIRIFEISVRLGIYTSCSWPAASCHFLFLRPEQHRSLSNWASCKRLVSGVYFQHEFDSTLGSFPTSNSTWLFPPSIWCRQEAILSRLHRF